MSQDVRVADHFGGLRLLGGSTHPVTAIDSADTNCTTAGHRKGRRVVVIAALRKKFIGKSLLLANDGTTQAGDSYSLL
jgi:hypothetical protein